MEKFQEIKKKVFGVINNIFFQKKDPKEAKSNLLNFIVKTKREQALKGRVDIKPIASSKKIEPLTKRLKRK